MDIAGSLGKIHVLPNDVIGRIAAGEVVERPAAVVKELIENSLDAGCTAITVDVKEGGLGLIRVTDDGEGMSRGDASLAFQRHATSKLRSDQQLDAIRTMGFRGEALPSIAAVSKVRLTTVAAGESVGTQLWLAGGNHQSSRRRGGHPRHVGRGLGTLLQHAGAQEVSQVHDHRVFSYQPCGPTGWFSLATGAPAAAS